MTIKLSAMGIFFRILSGILFCDSFKILWVCVWVCVGVYFFWHSFMFRVHLYIDRVSDSLVINRDSFRILFAILSGFYYGSVLGEKKRRRIGSKFPRKKESQRIPKNPDDLK